jgi:hypothetical protein
MSGWPTVFLDSSSYRLPAFTTNTSPSSLARYSFPSAAIGDALNYIRSSAMSGACIFTCVSLSGKAPQLFAGERIVAANVTPAIGDQA